MGFCAFRLTVFVRCTQIVIAPKTGLPTVPLPMIQYTATKLNHKLIRIDKCGVQDLVSTSSQSFIFDNGTHTCIYMIYTLISIISLSIGLCIRIKLEKFKRGKISLLVSCQRGRFCASQFRDIYFIRYHLNSS